MARENFVYGAYTLVALIGYRVDYRVEQNMVLITVLPWRCR